MNAATIPLESWVAHTILVGLLLAGAAWCLDRVLARAGLPTRWVWIGSLALTALVPVSGLTIAQSSAGDGVGPALPDASTAVAWLVQPVTGADAGADAGEPWPIALLGQASAVAAAGVEGVAGVVPGIPAFVTIVVVLWTFGSLALLVLLLRAQLRMARRRKSWPRAELHGRTVRVTPDLGPAVVGLLRPEIVVPAWARSLPTDELELVLAHEGEHVRGRDPLLLHAGLLPLVLFPWNPGLWWQFRRLRDAVEVDCDRRVLRRGMEPASYGRLLVRLGAHAGRDIVPAPAMSGSPSLLERRLDAMKKRSLKTTLPLALLGTAAAILLVAVACEVEPPISPHSVDPSSEARLSTSDQATAADLEAFLERTEAGGPVRDLMLSGDVRLFVVDGVTFPIGVALERLRGREIGSVEVVRSDRDLADALADEAARRGVVRVRTAETDRPSHPSSEPVFTPYEVAPQVRNVSTAQAALEREYPSHLRDAGIGGTVIVHFFITETGEVGDARVAEPSGHAEIDEAAVRVARQFEFVPARDQDEAVPVWVQIPITFQTR